MQISKHLGRQIMRFLHEVGTPAPDGQLLLDPEALGDKLAQLDLPAEGKGDEHDENEGDDGGDYDAVKDGKAAAAREIGERVARDKTAFR